MPDSFAENNIAPTKGAMPGESGNSSANTATTLNAIRFLLHSERRTSSVCLPISLLLISIAALSKDNTLLHHNHHIRMQ